MKFETGDSTDTELCHVLSHEYFRCDDSFKQFCFFAEKMIMQGENREISYRTYNAYADFIHHLYEFYLGCHARDNKNTNITNKRGEERTRIIEGYILNHAQRIMNGFRDLINNGTAPDWVNDISYYDVTVPDEFAKDFREYRNKVCGHVAFERSSELSLSEFYQKYHKYLYSMYRDAMYCWGNHGEEFPDLKEITAFTVMVERERT